MRMKNKEKIEEDNDDNMAHSHIEHSDHKEKEDSKRQYDIDIKTVERKQK